MKVGTGDEAHKTINIAEPFAASEFDGEAVGLDDSTHLGLEVWRKLHPEYWPRSGESGANHVISSLSVMPSNGYGVWGNKAYEVAARIREAKAMKGATIFEKDKAAALMNILFDEFRLHVRRQRLQSEKSSYEGTNCEETAARGAL